MANTTISLPRQNPNTVRATLRRWLKKPGESVQAGEILVELEIEQAYVQLESTAPGRLQSVHVQPGTTVLAGEPLGTYDTTATSSPPPSSPPPPRPPLPPPSPSASAMKNSSSAGKSSGDPSKVTPVLMPQAGNTMEEGTVLQWNVSEGDQISAGQAICEIETDKATMEFEAPDGGRLAKIVAGENQIVAVKQPIAYLADSDADLEAYLASLGAPTSAPAGGPTIEATTSARASAPSVVSSKGDALATASGRLKASPAARRLATEQQLDLASVGVGSGPGGRILSTDLVRATAGGRHVGSPLAALSTPTTASVLPAGATRRPMSKMRWAIAANLTKSKQTVPHFYCRMTFDAAALYSFYREHKASTGCSINDVITLACGRAIQEMPVFRSQVHDRDLVEFPHANIGIAVGIEDGLVVPVIPKVDEMSLATLSSEAKRIVGRAREGKLDNIGTGVFTISNLGMFGVEEFSAIINPPEAAILAVSAMRDAMVVQDGEPRVGKVMTMTLSTDHRVIDGVAAAKFLARLKDLLEAPHQLEMKA